MSTTSAAAQPSPATALNPDPESLHFASNTYSLLETLVCAASDQGYIGEPVSQYEHAVQAAYAAGNLFDAQFGGNDASSLPASKTLREQVVLAALCHDIGHLTPHTDIHENMQDPDPSAPAGKLGNKVINWGIVKHESLGASILSDLCLPRTVCDLVEAHVMVKRYLCGIDAAYYNGLSEASKATLRHQGGPLSREECERIQREDKLMDLKVLVRKADEAAKVPGLKVPEFADYKEAMIKVVQEEFLRRKSAGEWIGGHPIPEKASTGG